MYTRVKYWRLRKGWTQLDLSREAHISNQTIVNIERYGTTPSASTVRKLAKALDISTDKVFTDDKSQADGTEITEEQPANVVAA